MNESHLPREFPRIEPQFEVDALVDFLGGSSDRYKIQNLSLGGACILLPRREEIAVGAIVSLVINFPDQGDKLSLRGEVIWVNRAAPMDVGVRYLGLSPDDRDVLTRYLGSVQSSASL